MRSGLVFRIVTVPLAPPYLIHFVGAVPPRPVFGRDVRVAALVRSFSHPTKRVFDIFFADGRGMTAANAFDQRLQVRHAFHLAPEGFVVSAVLAVVAGHFRSILVQPFEGSP
jgi:hypothetical protein